MSKDINFWILRFAQGLPSGESATIAQERSHFCDTKMILQRNWYTVVVGWDREGRLAYKLWRSEYRRVREWEWPVVVAKRSDPVRGRLGVHPHRTLCHHKERLCIGTGRKLYFLFWEDFFCFFVFSYFILGIFVFSAPFVSPVTLPFFFAE